MGKKFVALDDRLYGYVCDHRSDALDPLLAELRAETNAMGEVSSCQISDEQGTFLTILAAATGARSAIEVGTFTGYSSICIARGLGTTGRLICVDQSKPWTDIARKYWVRAGLQSRIDLRVGPATKLLEALEPDLRFDFVFIDADKTGYDTYYELLLPRVRPNGLILFDNMLWGGRLGNGPISDPNGKALDELNAKLARDHRVDSVLIPVADGIQLCRKKS